MSRFYQSTFLVLFLAISLSACEAPRVNDADMTSLLKLKVTKVESGYSLSWSATSIRDFENYIVVRSAEPLPKDTDSPPTQLIVATLSEQESSQFLDKAFPLVDTFYYIIFVDIGDRFIQSQVVTVSQNIKPLPFVPNQAVISPEEKRFFLSESRSPLIHVYNYETQDFAADIHTTFTGAKLGIGKYQGREELYVYEGTKLKIYDARTLVQLENWSFSASIYSVTSNSRGLFFIILTSAGQPVYVIARHNQQILSSNTISGSSGSGKKLIMLSDSDNRLAEIGRSEINTFKFNEQGILLEKKKLRDLGFLNPLNNPAVSSDGNIFCGNAQGNVYNYNLDYLGKVEDVNFPGLRFKSIIFSHDNTKILATSQFRPFISILSFPQLKHIESAEIGFTPDQIFKDENDYYVLGSSIVSARRIYAIIKKSF